MSKRKRDVVEEVVVAFALDVALRDVHKIRTFVGFVMNMKLLNECVVMRWCLDGFRITIHDASFQGIALLFIPKEWFDDYSVFLPAGAQQTTTKVQTWVLNKALSILTLPSATAAKQDSAADSDRQTLRLFCRHHDGDVLSMEFINSKTLSVERQFDFPLLGVEPEGAGGDTDLVFQNTFNEGESDAEFQVSARRFAEDIKHIKLFGSTVLLSCSELDVKLSTKSEDTCFYSTSLGVDSISIVEGETHTQSFGLRILSDLCAFVSATEIIEIQITKDNPLRVVFLMDAGVSFVCHVVARN